MNRMKVKSMLTRRIAVPVVAAGVVLSLGTYELTRGASAATALPPATPAAGPLDDASVAPLLSLDQAMNRESHINNSKCSSSSVKVRHLGNFLICRCSHRDLVLNMV